MPFKFDPNKYQVQAPKPLPVILLLDVSGSMQGDKIDKLNKAVRDMISSFQQAVQKETVIKLAIITFGEKVNLHTPYTDVTNASGIAPLTASGWTPLGAALRLAKDMIEDKDETPSRAYRPVVVLVSDGQPNDDWEKPLEQFIHSGRSAKSQRFGIPIGKDADLDVIKWFTENDSNIFYADNAADIEKSFEKVTMSVSMRAASQNPDIIPNTNNYESSPAVSGPSSPAAETNDEDEEGW